MQLPASDLEVVRTRPQKTQLYLSVFQPTIVFQAQINDSGITKGARVISFDNVTLGSWTAVGDGMTMLIGSTPGADDLGKIRIRQAAVSSITVSENSNIAWANDAYITVQRFWRVDPIYPRIIQNPADETDVIFYKDYDVPYTNQNTVLGSFICMGSDRAAFLTNGSVQLNYTSSGTTHLLGESLTYYWFFEGATVTGSTSADPGLITYTTPGHYTTRLIVSGSNGSSDVSRRTVSIYTRPWQGNNPPIERWEMTNMGGSRDESGYKATFKIHDIIDVQENAVVVIFQDNWYGGTNRSFGRGDPNIFFVGRVLDNSIHYDYRHSEVEFQAASITEVMKTALGFSVSVESKLTPTKWYELYDMDCRRAIYHYLKWHTTALTIADFQFVGTDQKIQFFDSDRTSMFDAIDNFMRNTLLGQVVSDRSGKVWIEVEAKAYTNPTGSFTSVMDITKRDWRNEPTIDERLSDATSFLELGGVAYTGVHMNTFSALIASAPGNAPSFRGRVDNRTGMALSNQSDLNQIAGNVWANDNSPFPVISMDMAGNYAHLDIAPQETVFISIAPSDTVRNELIEGLYIPAGFNWQYSSRDQILLPSIEFENLLNGDVGQTVEVPISPVDAGIDTGFNVPGLQIPPLPILTIPPSYSNISTTVIHAYQNTFGQYTRQNGVGTPITTSDFIGMSLNTVEGISDGAGELRFNVLTEGMYFCIGHYYNKVSEPISAALLLTHSNLSGDVRINVSSPEAAINDIHPGHISQIFHLLAGGTVAFIWSTSGAGGAPDFISFQVFRIGAA